jgi:UDP-galactopyranose mutase
MTVIAQEFSEEYKIGKNDPYYPIPRKENDEIYLKYKKEAEKQKSKVFFVGRLADYKYYNMDQTVAVALTTFEKNIAK